MPQIPSSKHIWSFFSLVYRRQGRAESTTGKQDGVTTGHTHFWGAELFLLVFMDGRTAPRIYEMITTHMDLWKVTNKGEAGIFCEGLGGAA